MTTGKSKNIVFVVLAIFALACATKKDDHHDDTAGQKEWKEMDDFHMVMAETFHPYKDSSNLEPAKARAGELAAVAEKWADKELPSKVNNEEMKTKLQELREQTSALVQSVSGGDDQVIGAQLTRVHDTFHSIQESWYGGADDHEGHH